MRIVVTESAYQDFVDIKEYYKLEGVEQIADRQISTVLEHIDKLADHPQMGCIVPEYDSSSIRELIHPTYRVVYVLKPKEIQVIRIWRSERLLKSAE